jgi:hypothetical protein
VFSQWFYGQWSRCARERLEVAMAKSRKVLLVAAAAVSLSKLRQHAFVPPAGRHEAPAAAAGAVAMLGAAPVYADAIGDAAKKLSTAAYPFLKEVDWNSQLSLLKPGTGSATEYVQAIKAAIDMGAAMDSKLLKAGVEAHHKAIGSAGPGGLTSQADFQAVNAALGRMIASVPESKTMAVYDAFSKVVSSDVPPYLMSTVNEADAKKAYAALMEFKDVVKANPITPSAAAPVSSPAIDAAAGKLASAAYPFLKEVDWTSDLALKPLPGASPKDVLKAIDKALVMGAAMDGAALKEAADAHVKAIGSIDAEGLTSQADFAAINAGLGKAIASVPTSKVMDVYNAFAKVVPGTVPNFLYSTVNPNDAQAAYRGFLEFKDVVKAAR